MNRQPPRAGLFRKFPGAFKGSDRFLRRNRRHPFDPNLRTPSGGGMSERLYLFDTTLRDGQQTQGVQFSAAEKVQIAQALDALGVDYIEGGWPGANPTDSEFFAAAPQTRATMTAFGMTKRVGRSAAMTMCWPPC
jgi:hypothetical protein